ncbi:MAG: hypothetical protein OER97_08935 [Gammaproteobacteria bacterium]|nr:hypothetical protein [Gammaproteobacteria bacterium]
MTRNVYETNVEPGEFPFPIIKGPTESRYLTWIRNHSNYMAVRGPLDYLRAISVLLRGIVINSLVLLPFLMMISVLVALWYLLAPSFTFTVGILFLAVFSVLLFPLLTPHFKILTNRRRLRTGSDSSVWLRDKLERLFGGFLLAVLAATAFESLSFFLNDFHWLVYEADLKWPTIASVMAVAAAVFAAADKLLTVLGGFARKLAILVIGAFGVFVPLLFILWVSNFLVFEPPSYDWSRVTGIFFLGFIAVIAVAFILGIVSLSFNKKDFLKITLLMVGATLLLFPLIEADDEAWQKIGSFEAQLDKALDEINKEMSDTSTVIIEEVALATDMQTGDDEVDPAPDELDGEMSGDPMTLGYSDTDESEEGEAADGIFYRIKRTLGLIKEKLGLGREPDDNRNTELAEDLTRLVKDVANQPGPRLQELIQELEFIGYIEAPPEYVEELLKLDDKFLIDLADIGLPDVYYLREIVEGLTDEQRKALRPILVDLTNRMWALGLPELLHPDEQYARADSRDGVNPSSGLAPVPEEINALEQLVKAHTSGLAPTPDEANPLEGLVKTLITGHFDLQDRTVEYPDLAGDSENSELNYLVQTIVFLNDRLDNLAWQIPRVRQELAYTANYSRARYPAIYNTAQAATAREIGFVANGIYLTIFAIVLLLLSWLTVDVNLTSIHGLYRDRLASAFLVGQDTKGDVDVEKDLDLAEICRHEAGSTAPYHLINAAINLQGSKDIGIRDRQSDFFVFSKKFIGGWRTRYCRSETMERVFPQMGLATAMAISAAAASPNMGRSTNRALVAIMALLNIRLGFWIPNPGRLETWLSKKKLEGGKDKGYTFKEVFEDELVEITRRWEQFDSYPDRYLSAVTEDQKRPTPCHGLLGIGFSGGGIRSATLNLGIAQALHRRGIFDHIDYMSTVSGGGYLGSSISALMRDRKGKSVSEIFGRASVKENSAGKKIVSIKQPKTLSLKPRDSESPRRFSDRWPLHGETREYEFASYADIAVRDGKWIRSGQRLLSAGVVPSKKQNSFTDLFHWRVRPFALWREILGWLDETHRWVNVSDGGHIENLAGIELLRRRCKFIIIGDGEADPRHHFSGLATLIRTARIDLGVHIDINVDALRLAEKGRRKGLSQRHWAIGEVIYPETDASGYLLYLKSSVTGDEDEVIQQYRNTSPSFPHESTADQFFTEGQFEAYRSLGQHMAEQVFEETNAPGTSDDKMSFADFEEWFSQIWENRPDTGSDGKKA